MSDENLVLLPQGDGMCIGLVNIEDSKYDLNLNLALKVLEHLSEHNKHEDDEKRQFKIRIGLNENKDNLIIDINGNRNLSGAGINLCQRIMGLADAGNILVSRQVHGILSTRDKYFNSFNEYNDIPIKHGKISVYHYINEELGYLNSVKPSAFTPKRKPEEKIPELPAAYLVLLQRDYYKLVQWSSREDGKKIYSQYIHVMYWFLANDYVGNLHKTPVSPYSSILPWDVETIDQLLKYIDALPYRIASEFSHLLHKSNDFGKWIHKYAESIEYIFLKDGGLEKIKKDWPEMVEKILSETTGNL